MIGIYFIWLAVYVIGFAVTAVAFYMDLQRISKTGRMEDAAISVVIGFFCPVILPVYALGRLVAWVGDKLAKECEND